MFSSGRGGDDKEIPIETLKKSVAQAARLGCRVFYFTGGEPFVYPGFTEICDLILASPESHIVILTNAKGIRKFDTWLNCVDPERIHFQVSIDGLADVYDSIRGKGAFSELISSVHYLGSLNLPLTLAMTVTAANAHQMKDVITFAAENNVNTVHYMWLFNSGRTSTVDLVDHKILYENLIEAYEQAKTLSVEIDNIESLRSRLFTIAGTRFDLNNAGWESLAVAPDGSVYPTAPLSVTKSIAVGMLIRGWRKFGKIARFLIR